MSVVWATGLMAEMLRKSDAFPVATRHSTAMLFTRWPIRMCSIIATLAASLSVLTALLPAANVDMDERLESAIHREVVVGDLKGAMVQYQAVIRDSTNGPEIARALYRYGRCLEKLQRRTEAYQVYARVVKDFSDQPEAGLSRTRLAGWENSVSGPANLNFEQGVAGKLPDAWFVPAMPNDVDHWAQLRHSGCMSGDSCAVVLVPENAPVRAGNLMQSFSAAAYREERSVCPLGCAWKRVLPRIGDRCGSASIG